jgi:hypothetical protein
MTDRKTATSRKLQGLMDKFSQKLPIRLLQIEKDLKLLLRESWNKEVALRTYMELHKLSGTGGSFGFKAISDVARRSEEHLAVLIKQDGALSRSQSKELRADLARLRVSAAQLRHKQQDTTD